MRKTTMMAERVIALCLAFVIGFFSAFGAIAGGIYFVYSSVSLDKLNEWWGGSLPLNEFVNPDAEKPVTSLSIADLLAEIQDIQDSELTLKEMIERYGLLLPADVIESMPKYIMNEIPFSALFTEEGIQLVMDSVTVIDILNMIPEEIASTMLSDPARDAFSDNTLSEIVAMDMGHIFDGVQLGYITGVSYVLDENGVYQVAYADAVNPTLLEIVAPLDLGGILQAVSDGEGDVLEVVKNSIGDVAINSIFSTFMSDITIISGLIGEATLGDIIVLDSATGMYTIDMLLVMEGRKVGNLLGYTEVEDVNSDTVEPTYSWIDANGNKVSGISAKLSDIYVTDFMTGEASIDTLMDDLIIADVLGYEKGEKLPVFMHDNLENELIVDDEITVWYFDGAPADKLMSAFADKTVTWLASSVSTLKLADVLGYYMYDGEWYAWNVESVNGADAIVLSQGSAIMSEIAGTEIGNMGDIESSLKDIKIGTLLAYESVLDEDGNHYWSTGVDENNNPVEATGITASMADLTINELADGHTLQATIDDIKIADVMGYTKGEDGKWYKGGEVVSGPMAALAESKVGSLATDINSISIGELLGHTPIDENGDDIIDYWENANGEVVSGLMAAFVGLSVNDMKDNDAVMNAVHGVKVCDVMGLQLIDGIWYDSDGITKASPVMSAIADVNVGELSSAMDDIKVGEILGYTYNESEDCWYSGDAKVSGVTGALANSTLSSLNDDLDALRVGDVAGYVELEAADPNATEGEGWYQYDSMAGTYVKATGILAELSDLTVNQLTNSTELTNKIGNVKLADALGYIELEDGDPNTTDGRGGWYKHDSVTGTYTEITGIMAALADKPINDMSNAVNDLTLDDVLPGEKDGFLAMIDGETKINDIGSEINRTVQSTPLQFFIGEGMIALDESTMRNLDLISQLRGDIVSITDEESELDYYAEWISQNNGIYEIPNWRKQPLTGAFNYMLSLLS